jgi:hypothetical protein
MNRAHAYLEKTLPVAPSVPEEIEERPSVESAPASAVAGFLGLYLACEPDRLICVALNRPSRDEISIRNAIAGRIFRDWRSLSRLRGLRRFFYMPESTGRLR